MEGIKLASAFIISVVLVLARPNPSTEMLVKQASQPHFTIIVLNGSVSWSHYFSFGIEINRGKRQGKGRRNIFAKHI